MGLMKILTTLMILLGLVLITPADARAGCASRANDVASRPNVQVLAVSSFRQGDREMCRITVLIKSRNGGPARKKTIIVQK